MRFEEGGFATLIWYTGSHAYGVYKEIVEHEKIVMTWHDGTDQITKLKIKLETEGDSIKVNLWHKGFTDDERAAYYENLWQTQLHELKGMLETGARPSISERIIVGVLVDTSESAQTEEGVTILRAVEGFSAADAGLQSGDIITQVNGQVVNNQNGIGDAIAGKKVGDEVEVIYLRDGEETTIIVALKGHPVPPIPKTFDEMAQQHTDEHNRVISALEKAIADVTDTIAEYKPDEDSWNIKQIISHMIVNQRHVYEWLGTYANGPRRINPYYRDAERINAIIDVYPTVDALVGELKAVQAETVAIINNFDKALEARKDYIWWMTFEVWLSEDTAMGHIADIEERKQQAAA